MKFKMFFIILSTCNIFLHSSDNQGFFSQAATALAAILSSPFHSCFPVFNDADNDTSSSDNDDSSVIGRKALFPVYAYPLAVNQQELLEARRQRLRRLIFFTRTQNFTPRVTNNENNADNDTSSSDNDISSVNNKRLFPVHAYPLAANQHRRLELRRQRLRRLDFFTRTQSFSLPKENDSNNDNTHTISASALTANNAAQQAIPSRSSSRQSSPQRPRTPTPLQQSKTTTNSSSSNNPQNQSRLPSPIRNSNALRSQSLHDAQPARTSQDLLRPTTTSLAAFVVIDDPNRASEQEGFDVVEE